MFINPEFYPKGPVAFVPSENLTVYRFGDAHYKD